MYGISSSPSARSADARSRRRATLGAAVERLRRGPAGTGAAPSGRSRCFLVACSLRPRRPRSSSSSSSRSSAATSAASLATPGRRPPARARRPPARARRPSARSCRPAVLARHYRKALLSSPSRTIRLMSCRIRADRQAAPRSVAGDPYPMRRASPEIRRAASMRSSKLPSVHRARSVCASTSPTAHRVARRARTFARARQPHRQLVDSPRPHDRSASSATQAPASHDRDTTRRRCTMTCGARRRLLQRRLRVCVHRSSRFHVRVAHGGQERADQPAQQRQRAEAGNHQARRHALSEDAGDRPWPASSSRTRGCCGTRPPGPSARSA